MISWRLIQKAKGILEKEKGTVTKSWGGKMTVCLLYPNHYHVGMSNLGFQTLYQTLNAEEDVVCERAFLPEPEDFQEYEKGQTVLFSLESQKPLSGFDLLAFSISFENDFLNVLTLLALAHVPLERGSRGPRDPLVMAGGAAVFLNPEPLADFFDLFVLGEAEEVVGEFLEVYRRTFFRGKEKEKEALFREMGKIEGIYVPGFYQVTYSEEGKIDHVDSSPGISPRIKRRWVKELDRFPTRSVLFTPDTEFKEMALLEVNRGCPRGCRFCAATFIYAPFRNRSLSVLETLSEEGLKEKARIGLAGAAVSDHPGLVSLCRRILTLEGGFSLASLRLDALTPALVQCLKEGGHRAIAIAPEAGSERLRRFIKKGYREEDILNAVKTLVTRGVSQLKCYFLIGLPSETDGDVKEIVHLARKIRHQGLSHLGKQGVRLKIVLSVNPFIPKPATPLQWAPMERVEDLKRKLKIIQREIRREEGIEMIYDLPKWAYLQALLSRGDRRVGKILLAAHRLRGDWAQALRETSLNPDFYVYRQRDLDEVFPWDFIDHGTSKEVLKREYLKAMEEAGVGQEAHR
jgi:radical SAM family uncharacterized protein